MLKGWKTVIFGLAMAVAPSGFTYLMHVDWTKLIGPNAAFLVAGGITLALRAVTDTSIFSRSSTVNFTPTGRAMVIGFLVIGAALFEGWGSPARAADLKLPTKAMVSPFVPNADGGWYVGLGTSAGLANGSSSGSNLFAPSLVGGNLVADGASVDIDGGYIKNGGPLGTWWRLQAGLRYQNISGGTPVGSISSRWQVFEEADIGANILTDVFSKIGSLGNLSSTFTALNSFVPVLPSNVAVVGTPQQYVGAVLEETDLSGSFGASTGQTWMLDYGVKTGWIWELPGSDGKTPNGNALEVFAQVTWPNQGLTLANVFAANGAPLTIGPAIKMGPMYRAGVTYQFGL